MAAYSSLQPLVLSHGDSLKASTSCEGCCNGLESNCILPVNEVLFPMVHNAHSSFENNFMMANNNLPLEEALVAGYRGLMLDSCMCEGVLSQYLLGRDEEWGLGNSNLGFCHSVCGAGVRDPKEVLTNIKSFVETNPNEVRDLLFCSEYLQRSFFAFFVENCRRFLFANIFASFLKNSMAIYSL